LIGASIQADSKLPELETLLSTEAASGPLSVVVESGGATLVDSSITQISYRPERRLTVVYDTVDAEGTHLPVVLTAGEIPAEAALLESAGHRLGAWTAWRDPAIPGLALVLDPRTRRELLGSLGVPDVATTARMRSYRPGKRAVVEVTGDGVRLFVKTIRPKDVTALQEAHTALADSLPIPRSLGWSPEAGIVVLEPLPGVPLSSAPDQGPDARSVLGLLERIPSLDRKVSPRRRRLTTHLHLLRRVVANQEHCLQRIERAAESLVDFEPVPVHGDFHSGQILVSHRTLTGLVDIDTVGMGNRADDHANLLAHLHIIALRNPGGAAARYGELVYRAAVTQNATDDLRIRVAATMLGYASGPWSRQESGWPARVDRLIEAGCEWLPGD
jgi:aminoglycoside phosphotransferase